MTTKQYTREEINRHAIALYAELPAEIAAINDAMLRQCLARIDRLEAEPSEAEIEAATQALLPHNTLFSPTWPDEMGDRPFVLEIISSPRRASEVQAKAALKAAAKVRRGA